MLHGSPFPLRETERGKNNSKMYLVERETESDVKKKIEVSQHEKVEAQRRFNVMRVNRLRARRAN